MKEKIFEIISSVTKKPLQELENDFYSAKFCDSLQKVEIILSIEEEFNIFFDTEDLSEMISIESIIRLTEGKISNEP